MSTTSAARVLDASIFPILKNGIDTFVDQSLHNIEEAEKKIAQMGNELAKVGETLNQRLNQSHIVLNNANMKLNLCETQPPHYDENGEAHYPSCSSERHDVRVVMEQVKAAENCLNLYKECLREIEQHKSQYQSRKDRFMRLIDDVLYAGSSEMLRQWKLMEDYIGNSVFYQIPGPNEFNAEELHPILRPFVPSITSTTAAFSKIDEMWQDTSAEIFKVEIAERWQNDTKEYLLALEELAIYYEAAMDYSRKLLSGTAGVGSWINIYQAEMLIKRKVSRWLTGRDDYRF